MAATLAPNAGGLPSAASPTPASEKSIYYEANTQSGEHFAHAQPNYSTDAVTHSSAHIGVGTGTGTASATANQGKGAGALEPREPATGGVHANKKDNSKVKSDSYDTKESRNVRDSGYADTKEKRASSSPQQQAHDVSPAYIEAGSKHGAADTKTAVSGTGTEAAVVGAASGHSGPRTQSPTQKDQQTGSPQSTTSSPHTSGQMDRPSHASGAFANGAGITGPNAIPEEDVEQHQRTATAESQISEEAKKKISKAEVKDAKRLMKVIKSEGKAQEANLSAFLKELSKLQAIQKQASKDESKALSADNKATAVAHKLHTKFLQAKAAYEQADSDARARKETLEAARVHAQETTADLAVKTREAEELRRAKMVDDREREARLVQLSQTGKQK